MVDLDSETDSNHDTALTLACAGGHEELVTLLLSRGADIEHRDKKGFTPLILAATAGHDKVSGFFASGLVLTLYQGWNSEFGSNKERKIDSWQGKKDSRQGF